MAPSRRAHNGLAKCSVSVWLVVVARLPGRHLRWRYHSVYTAFTAAPFTDGLSEL
jgi:hypothetical protein